VGVRSYGETASRQFAYPARASEPVVVSIWAMRGGIKAGKRHVSNEALGRHAFLADVGRAMARAGLPVPRWKPKHTESLYYRMVHELAEVFGLHVPEALKPLAKQAALIQHGVMSPTMNTMQAAEPVAQGLRRIGGVTVLPDEVRERLAADEVEAIRFALSLRRQRLDQLAARLKNPLAAWRQRLDGLAARLKAVA